MTASSPIRLGLLAAAPVYYQTPLYRRLAADPRLEFTAIFASDEGVRPVDADYGAPVVWDVDVVDGYRSVFLRRAARNPFRGRFLTLRDPDVVGLVGRARFDVLWLHGYNFLTHQLAALTQRARRGTVFFREEQTLLHGRPPVRAGLKEIGLRLAFHGAFALYIGEENRRWFAHYGVPEERMFFVPYCVDNAALRTAHAELAPRKATLRRELGVADDGGPLVLMVGRLIPKKQPELLLEAFRRVRAKHRCTLVFVGSGPLERELANAVAAARIPDVVLAGFRNRSEIAGAYAAADVFVLPSREHETWGLVVNEALNFGLPVVVTDKVGCAADLVHDGENGFVVPADDPGPLAERLELLVASEGLRDRLGGRSPSIVERYDPNTAATGVLSAVAQAVGAKRWRRSGDEGTILSPDPSG